MNVIAVDDEKHALEDLADAIEQAIPDARLYCFRKISDAIEFAGKMHCDIAFLDIEMRGMNGLQLAKCLKDIYGDTNIVFVTSYTEYAVEAYRLYPSGYLLKPVTAEDVKRELQNLRYPVKKEEERKLKIRCFGNFEAYYENELLHFRRSKTMELLAYLVDRQGSPCTMGELIGVLWEDRVVSPSLESNLRNLIHDLRTTLSALKMGDVVVKARNVISLRTELVDCDYYDFLKGIPGAVNLYQGEYMAQYSWAEMTTAALSSLPWN